MLAQVNILRYDCFILMFRQNWQVCFISCKEPN